MEISLETIKKLSVTVMGLGLNGGGLVTAEFFAKHGANVTVTDLKTEEELKPSVEKLKVFSNIRFVLGCHRLEDFQNSDLVIKNPGVKREGNKFLEAAKNIESDISIFLSLSKSPILAVTGSKGKSSTVSALYYGLKNSNFNAFLGGNITVSPLSFLEQTDEHTPVVLELSSWQLADLKNRSYFKPEISIITPIMPDHLNWYGTMEKYVADKKLIYKNIDENNILICNYDDGWGKIFASETKAKVFWYSEKKLPENSDGAFFDNDQNGICKINGKKYNILSSKAKVPGIKLRQNVLNAGLALLLYGVKQDKLLNVMDSYGGIEHRMECFYEKNGVKFYNDSAATIPEAAAAAVNAFSKPPILICGGTDKNLDFTPLVQNARKAKNIFLLNGSGTEVLIPLLKNNGIKYIGGFNALEELLAVLKPRLEKGDNVVLSPGATSFGMFKNEFDRGNKFKEAVKKII